MEYVQAVLFLVNAERLSELARPSGLLAALEAHKAYLQQQPGFLDMSMIRSPNTEGPVQVVVETRWVDAEGLLAYEREEPNVAAIVNRYSGAIVPRSLQIYDMEVVL